MIVSVEQMKAIEQRVFERGLATPESLMEKVGARMADALRELLPPDRKSAIVFAGKGNNAGDAFVLARHLAQDNGWKIGLRLAYPREEMRELPRKKLEELEAVTEVVSLSDLRDLKPGDLRRIHGFNRPVCLDGLLGIGTAGEPRDPIAGALYELARVKAESLTVSMDAPTGLFSSIGTTADLTLTVGYPKDILFHDDAPNYVGRLAVIPLEEFSDLDKSDIDFSSGLTGEYRINAPGIRRRFDSHKAVYGKVGIVAGSPGFLGAAIMTSTAALRAGAGLVTLFVTEDIYPLLAIATPPEVMVMPVTDFHSILDLDLDAMAIGPGLGPQPVASDSILNLIREFTGPAVVDADALNLLSRNKDSMSDCKGHRVLTPHPGEMKRLWSDHPPERIDTATDFISERPGTTLLLKGSRTIICSNQGGMIEISFNLTGNPGMATGGSGDILTGVIAGLLGQKPEQPYQCAREAAWLCGRAAEIAISHGPFTEETLLPMDTLDYLGAAFDAARTGGY